MDIVFGHADRVLVLNRGELIAEGSPEEVRVREDVRAVYLGAGFLHGAAASERRAFASRGSAPLTGGRACCSTFPIEVGAGEAVALIGRNGAGKSTTMRAILGLIKHRSGEVIFRGRDISAWPTHAIVRAGLGYVPEDRRIFSDLTTEENLEVGRQPRRANAPLWTAERLYDLSQLARAQRAAPARGCPAANSRCSRSPVR